MNFEETRERFIELIHRFNTNSIESLKVAKITASLKSKKGKKKAEGVNELIEKVIKYINN